MTQEQHLRMLQPADLKKVAKENQMNRVLCKRSDFPHMHSWGEEGIAYTKLWLEMKIFWFSTWGVTVNTSKEDKQNRSRAVFKAVFVFFCKAVPTFHFSYLLHPEGCHRGELCRAALQECSNGPQRKSLALLLNNPVRLWAVSQAIVSSLQLPIATFSVVEKRDSSFSEPLSTISRQCRRRQFLSSRESRHFKETVGNYGYVHWCTWLPQRSVTSFIVLQRKTLFLLFFRCRGLLNRITPHSLLKGWGYNIFQSSNHFPWKPEPMESIMLCKCA